MTYDLYSSTDNSLLFYYIVGAVEIRLRVHFDFRSGSSFKGLFFLHPFKYTFFLRDSTESLVKTRPSVEENY